MGFPDLAENIDIPLLYKYFVNCQSIGMIFKEKTTRVVNNIVLMPKSLTHLSTARYTIWNKFNCHCPAELVGKSEALFNPGRLKDEWHEFKGAERRRSDGEEDEREEKH